MARWSTFLAIAIAIALAVPCLAFADQKKPINTTTTSGTITHRKAGGSQQEYLTTSGGIKGDTTDQGHEKWLQSSSPTRGSTGPTVLPKPTQGNTHK
jgi:hypothetical protein